MPDNSSIIFSIIIPTYNRASLIGDTLQSILSQTFTQFEVLVIDDGSKDDTAHVMAVWAEKDARIKYLQKENGERGAARNYGIERAQGQYITFIDSDDIAYDNYLQHAYHNLYQKQWPQCYAQAYEIKEKATGRLLVSPKNINTETVNEDLLKGNLLSCIGVFVKKEVFNTLKFEADRNFAGTEDWLLWLQLAARYPIFYSNKVTAAMLEHDTRSVLSFPEEKLVYRTEHLRKVLSADKEFMKKYGKPVVDRIYAHMLTYTSLHLAMTGKKNRALYFLLKAAQVNFKEVRTRRTLAIIKKVILG